MFGPQSVCVYQFRVVLRGISPMIWRRLLMRSDDSIADLHYAIQIAMGWSDPHLHRFQIHGKDYGVAHEGGILFTDNPEKVQLADFEFRIRERFLYEYDFYDSWEHDVRLEKVLPWSSQHIGPLCAGGRRLAPPEDCGGARVYMKEGDPRWRQWWDTMPRQELALIAETVKRVLDFDGDHSVIKDRQSLLAALERVKAHRAASPDRFDRRVINERLGQYTRGERAWLFCETIGG
jgi:Plasmid pRiA4b ORF-3-like protein